jgi:hypothetical protein
MNPGDKASRPPIPPATPGGLGSRWDQAWRARLQQERSRRAEAQAERAREDEGRRAQARERAATLEAEARAAAEAAPPSTYALRQQLKAGAREAARALVAPPVSAAKGGENG